MIMYKTIPTFILLFTGYLHTNMNVAANTPTPSGSSVPALKAAEAPELGTTAHESETPAHENNSVPAEEHLASLIVAGISMTVVFLFILVIIGACYVWKKSKRSLVENNSDPSSEHGVSLKDFQHLKTSASGLLEVHYADSGRAVA